MHKFSCGDKNVHSEVETQLALPWICSPTVHILVMDE